MVMKKYQVILPKKRKNRNGLFFLLSTTNKPFLLFILISAVILFITIKNIGSFSDTYTTVIQSSSQTTASISPLSQWLPFNESNPHQKTWCPTAQCLNSPLCTPCNRRHIFILSTARSGSTTLLRMFNTLPHTRISGENHNTFGLLSNLEQNLLNNKPQLLKHPMDKPTGPFRHNTIPKQSLSCISQNLHYTMNPPPLSVQQNQSYSQYDLRENYDKYTILGMKSVRLHLFKEVKIAVKFYKRHFPCSKFIINVQSNITHQLESYMRTFNGTLKMKMSTNSSDISRNSQKSMDKIKLNENSAKRYLSEVDTDGDDDTDDDDNDDQTTEIIQSYNITNVNDTDTQQKTNTNLERVYNGPKEEELINIRDFHIKVGTRLGPSYARIIEFDKWMTDVSMLNDVLDWLGYVDCSFSAISHENENGYGVDNTTLIDVGENCHYPYYEEE